MDQGEVAKKVADHNNKAAQIRATRLAQLKALEETKKTAIVGMRKENEAMFKTLEEAKLSLRIVRMVPDCKISTKDIRYSDWHFVLHESERAVLKEFGVKNPWRSFADMEQNIRRHLQKAEKSIPIYVTILSATKGGKKVAEACAVCVAEDGKNRVRGEVKTTGLNIALKRLVAQIK